MLYHPFSVTKFPATTDNTHETSKATLISIYDFSRKTDCLSPLGKTTVTLHSEKGLPVPDLHERPALPFSLPLSHEQIARQPLRPP